MYDQNNFCDIKKTIALLWSNSKLCLYTFIIFIYNFENTINSFNYNCNIMLQESIKFLDF